MITFRNDDVSGNSDPEDIREMYQAIYDLPFETRIISCVTVFSSENDDGSIYPYPPFKDKEMDWFYDVNQVTGNLALDNIASHGLFHIDHTKVNKETQAMSILGSCNYLQTRTFVPPFGKWNEDTKDICDANNISLLGLDQKWLSLEFNEFDSEHEYWYFHSWRYTPEDFREALLGKQPIL